MIVMMIIVALKMTLVTLTTTAVIPVYHTMDSSFNMAASQKRHQLCPILRTRARPTLELNIQCFRCQSLEVLLRFGLRL